MAIELKLRLNAPGMTSLHRVGLAGLYMTLRAFEARGENIPGLEWRLGPRQVTLNWMDETPKAAFEKLIDKSFWIDNEGFIRLAGLEADGPLSTEKKHHLYNALLNSFLQFGPHRPTETKRTLTYEVDEHLCQIKDFAPIKDFRHRKAAVDFVDNEGHFKPSIEAAGWLYPGGGQRHVVHSNTKLNELTELALALMFAPVGVVYYIVKSRAKGRKARLAMIIPEIRDLELYAEIRRAIAAQGTLELTASGASDAALRMLLAIEANSISNKFATLFAGSYVCRVVTFGIVPWNEKQKSRTYTRSVVSGRLHGLENYRAAAAIFKNRWQHVQARTDRKGNEIEPERSFVTTFSARELIADNVARGEAWYHDIAAFVSQGEAREQLLYERKELHEMVESASFDDESERLFIGVCHESWRRRMGKLGERARNESLGDAGFKRLVSKEAEKLRTSLARSKNADTLRETVVDFWARAGANEALQGGGLMKLLPLFTEKNWRKTRDLALLALISYQPQSTVEKEAFEADIVEEGEGL